MTFFKAAASWQLERGAAQTLHPDRAGVLRVHQGRVWATFDRSAVSTVADAGDHFVLPGLDLAVRAGQRLVVEAWPGPSKGEATQGVTLLWEPVARAATNAGPVPTSLLSPPKSRPGWLPLGQPTRP